MTMLVDRSSIAYSNIVGCFILICWIEIGKALSWLI